MPSQQANDPGNLETAYRSARKISLDWIRPLSPEDCNLQASVEVSPVKWHLAHTTWFFETFILIPYDPSYMVFDPSFGFKFNSYYEGAGSRHPRKDRGLLSRPLLEGVLDYRQHVDQAMETLIRQERAQTDQVAPLVWTGINHEQQHQELMLTDIMYNFFQDPSKPAYQALPPTPPPAQPVAQGEWVPIEPGVYEIGFSGDGFYYDNEAPSHHFYVNPVAIMNQLVTCGEYREFVEQGGYERPELWLSEGWTFVSENRLQHPLYWCCEARGGWNVYGLSGLRPLEPCEPVTHLCFFEADAYARWRGLRLPTEQEWEVFAREMPVRGLFETAWQWTSSPYVPYPGFKSLPGTLGEYNGKFMCQQYVLRGGSSLTPLGHTRPTYRNFFYPDARWQMAGLRLAKDL